MYLARKIINGKIHYFLRESYREGDLFYSRELMALGENPSVHIKYPGGNSYYIGSHVEETLLKKTAAFDDDLLDDIFQPFIRPEIRRAIAPFQNRTQNRSRPKKPTQDEETFIRARVPAFDKRRVHFLKYGCMAQGPVARMPSMLFRGLIYKSRDEIEQSFIAQEERLNPSELKTYTYVALDLQRFFPNFLASKMPQALNQEKVDDHFLEEICHINQHLFPEEENQHLHPYLVRYACMFFDHEYAGSFLLDDLVKDFMYRHHFHRRQPPQKSVSLERASRIFDLPKDKLEKMSRKQLTRLYRRKAMKLHPDTGGSQREFVTLTEAYQSMLHKLKK